MKQTGHLRLVPRLIMRGFIPLLSGFGGADVACWPLIPKFEGSNPAEAVGFLRAIKIAQHAFLRKGGKIIGPMSQICGM
jgi:hypothetical protein